MQLAEQPPLLNGYWEGSLKPSEGTQGGGGENAHPYWCCRR